MGHMHATAVGATALKPLLGVFHPTKAFFETEAVLVWGQRVQWRAGTLVEMTKAFWIGSG